MSTVVESEAEQEIAPTNNRSVANLTICNLNMPKILSWIAVFSKTF